MPKFLAKLLSKKKNVQETEEQDIVQAALLMRMDRVMQAQASPRHAG